jgi:hypothetical protein
MVFWENGPVKTTIDLPDDLITEVKIEAARQKKKLKELVPELVRVGLQVRRQPEPLDRQAAERWLDEWVEMGRVATRDLPPGPTATEILSSDRDRLERR